MIGVRPHAVRLGRRARQRPRCLQSVARRPEPFGDGGGWKAYGRRHPLADSGEGRRYRAFGVSASDLHVFDASTAAAISHGLEPHDRPMSSGPRRLVHDRDLLSESMLEPPLSSRWPFRSRANKSRSRLAPMSTQRSAAARSNRTWRAPGPTARRHCASWPSAFRTSPAASRHWRHRAGRRLWLVDAPGSRSAGVCSGSTRAPPGSSTTIVAATRIRDHYDSHRLGP